ncbi:GtrA family protein [Enterobacter asburiae]|uniref:GtrA family protein n=1 Tax=Enterobacter asburiae TaxID=61645 RepID=UPI002FC5A4A6
MIKLFSRYFIVGFFNTAVHWISFSVLFHLFGTNQTAANIISFSVAVTFSFICNAKWTFKQYPTAERYVVFVLFMGILSALTGYIADKVIAPPLVTLTTFSALSLVAGFLYSKFIVFRNAK